MVVMLAASTPVYNDLDEPGKQAWPAQQMTRSDAASPRFPCGRGPLSKGLLIPSFLYRRSTALLSVEIHT